MVFGNCFAYLLLFLRAQDQEIFKKVRIVFLHTVLGKIPVKNIQYNKCVSCLVIAIMVAFVVVIHVQCLVSVYLSLVKIKYSVCVSKKKRNMTGVDPQGLIQSLA